MKTISAPDSPLSEASHPRTFRSNAYVYPVLSRRSGGVSVGLNLNPDKACNFDCIYCQVDRSRRPSEFFVGLPKLLDELRDVLTGLGPGGRLWDEPEFTALPAEKRQVKDLAFSGDGEPTTFRNFAEVVRRVVEVKEALGCAAARTVLITNATGLDRPAVRKGLACLDAHNGEVWAKLDAGTPEFFRLVGRTAFPFAKVLANIGACARERPIVIQSCFLRLRGAGPAREEIGAYVERLRDLAANGGRIQLVQIYTVARPPAYGIVSSLSQGEVDALVARVAAETGLPCRAFYGNVPEGQGLLGNEPAAPRAAR